MEMAHNLYLFTFVLNRTFFRFLFHWPLNSLKFWVFINNLGRRTFSAKRTSSDFPFFDSIPTWNVITLCCRIQRKNPLEIHFRILSFIWRLTSFIKCIIANAINESCCTKYSPYYEKRMWNYNVIFLTLNYSNTHSMSTVRGGKTEAECVRSLVCVLKQSKASFNIIWSESVFMRAKEFASERIIMTFQMRHSRWTEVELYWQFMPNVWGWSAYIITPSAWWWWWWLPFGSIIVMPK